MQSQAVESPDRALRITLNGSMGAQTLSARFLQHYMGAGVQHLAFATADIFAAAEAARANGLPMLEIPHNYYDDLEAKFGLAPELVERLAKFNILYDRDGTAEYFQFYSRAFAKRLFFEIVERRGYEAYGAGQRLDPARRSSPLQGGKSLDCAPQSHENGATSSAGVVALGASKKTAGARSAERSRASSTQHPRHSGPRIRGQRARRAPASTRSPTRSTRRSA